MDVQILEPLSGSQVQHDGSPFTVQARVTDGVPDIVLARFFQTVSGTQQLVLTVELSKDGTDWDASVDPSALNLGSATLKVLALTIADSAQLSFSIVGSSSSSSSSSP